jgi:[ribosomal protein S5]-alanine N-acetyltransferase
MQFTLIPCGADGRPLDTAGHLIGAVPEAIAATYAANAELHRRLGFTPPWGSYIAVDAGGAVGGGAFVGPPRENRVEIAYFTLPEAQGRGYATRTAAALIAIARQCEAKIFITALTLPHINASTRILQRLGFNFHGNAHDADAGEVWEWRLQPPLGA